MADYSFREIVRKKKVDTLCWQGDRLIDLQSGWQMDTEGEMEDGNYFVGYKFDTALASPSGRFAVLFERLGTKALMFERAKIVRELNRSYYFAETYEYPVAFCTLPDGTELLIHCPEKYCRIDIEVAATGRILTDTGDRKPADAFYSRLTVSPRGTWLASAGWLWHPMDFAAVWSIEDVLKDPRLLDRSARLPCSDEVSSIAFLDDDRAVASVRKDETSSRARQDRLLTLDLHNQAIMEERTLSAPPGTLVSFGADLVLALHGHPRLLRVSSGATIHEWPHLLTGEQGSSIIHHIPPPPPFAKHPTKPIFAVADQEKVTLICLDGILE